MNKNYEILIKNIAFTDNALEYHFDGIEEELEKFFSVLDDNEQVIMRYRYGFDDGIFKTNQEVAEKFGLTLERVKQIEKLTFRKLRVLFGLNGKSFIFNSKKIEEDVYGLLEAQQFYDGLYSRDKGVESSSTKFYKRVIEVSKSYKNNKRVLK